mgnify:CR=1 FL=1
MIYGINNFLCYAFSNELKCVSGKDRMNRIHDIYIFYVLLFRGQPETLLFIYFLWKGQCVANIYFYQAETCSAKGTRSTGPNLR